MKGGAIVLVLLVLLFGGSAFAGGGGKGKGGGGGGGGGGRKPKPGAADDEEEKIRPTPFRGGRVWGDTRKVPASWRGDWNDFWISPDCDVVAEGAKFLPESGNFWAEPEPTLVETLAVKLGGGVDPNTAWGFIDYLTDIEGLGAAEPVAHRIVQEAAPICADVPMQQWPRELASWFDDFVMRIDASEFFEP